MKKKHKTVSDKAFGMWADHEELEAVDVCIDYLRKGRFEDFEKCTRGMQIIKNMHKVKTNDLRTDEIMALTRMYKKNSNKQS